MAISVADLAKTLSKDAIIADMAKQWNDAKLGWVPYVGIDPAKHGGELTVTRLPLADHVTGNTETKLTETGRWLLKALETMTGNAYWEMSAEQYENRVKAYNPASKLRFSIGRQEMDELDPVVLLDCFTCAACGCDTSRIESHRCGFVQSENWKRARGVCEACYPKRRADVDDAISRVEARNQRLGIHPQAIMWQRGGHGVRLEKSMAIKYEGKIEFSCPLQDDEFYEALRSTHRAISDWADKQITTVLLGQDVNSGQMVVRKPDGTVGPAGAAKPAHEFRVGDRVRLSHPGWAKVIRGQVTTITEIAKDDWFKLALLVDGRPLECGSGMFEPLFKVGTLVNIGFSGGRTGTITRRVSGYWEIPADDDLKGSPYCRYDKDIEPIDLQSMPKVNGHDQYAWMPKVEPKTPDCPWCGDAYATSQQGTTAHVRDCLQYDKLYRDRLSAGGADCPEARDEVRRFVKRRSELRIVNEGVTNGDADRVMATRPRGEKMLSLDQRIAAAQAEERPRHASDWSAWSTHTDES